MEQITYQTIDPDGTICFHLVEIGPTPEEQEQQRLHEVGLARNEEWLRNQWPRLIPECLGKWLGVGGQESFVAQTRDEATEWVKASHPEDRGAFVDLVSPRWQSLFAGGISQLESPRTRIEYHGPDEEMRDYYRCVELRKRTSEWLLPHWPRLLPEAMGNHLAVGNRQIFIARTSEEALAWLAAHHADDDSRIVEHVKPFSNQRTYPNHARPW